MPVQRKHHHAQARKKKKSLISFLLVLIVSLAVGIPLAYKLNTTTQGSVEGISSASESGSLKAVVTPCPSGTQCGIEKLPTPPVYLNEETLTRGTCFPAFQKISYTCSDNFQTTYQPPNCTSPQKLLKIAESECLKRGSPSGTPKPKTSTTGNT